jgi:hypothetical protein
MTSINQRAELQAKIWRIANDVRGSVETPTHIAAHFQAHTSLRSAQFLR